MVRCLVAHSTFVGQGYRFGRARLVPLEDGGVDVVGDRGAGGAASHPVFDHYDHGVMGLFIRRKGGEPGRVAGQDIMLVLHLGRAGLGADAQAGHRRCPASAVRVFGVPQHRLAQQS